jgi:thiol-disulfide isomerase/thioredoxin
MNNRWRLSLGLWAIAAIGACGCSGDGGVATPPSPAPAPGASFKIAFSAEGVSGGEVSLADYHGKVVLVDMFGTWCPPCRRSVPALVSLFERFRERGFEVVGLAYERTENVAQVKETVRTFAGEFKIPYTLAIGPKDLMDQIPGGFEGFPTMVLVDRQGIARKHFVGYAPGHEEVLAQWIENLLDEPAVGP